MWSPQVLSHDSLISIDRGFAHIPNGEVWWLLSCCFEMVVFFFYLYADLIPVSTSTPSTDVRSTNLYLYTTPRTNCILTRGPEIGKKAANAPPK